MAKKYGYARVSTKGQAKDGYSLEDQKNKLIEAGAEEVYEDAFTGTKLERPELKKLLNKLESEDTLIVCKLDRISRSASQGSELVKNLLDKGVSVHILNMGYIDNSTVGKLIMQIMFAFAEFERDSIVDRTQEGKEIAKTKEGFKEGRPRKYDNEQLALAMTLLKQGNSYGKVAKMTKISKGSIYREAVKAGLVNKEYSIDV